MKKENYLQQKEAIELRISQEKAKLENLKMRYIQSHSPYEIGQKVKIVTPPHKIYTVGTWVESMSEHKERFAYVDGYEIEYGDNVRPILKKAKKDGSKSLQRDYYNESFSYLEIVR